MSPELRFCANLKWLFTELAFPARFDAAAAAGFRAVEYASPYAYRATDQQRWLSDNGLQLKVINTPTGSAGSLTASGQACHPHSVVAFQRDFALALDYATTLGCPMIHLQAGIRPPEISVDHAFATLCQNVSDASQLAAKQGITLLLEAINPQDIPGYFLTTQEAALSVIEQVASPSVGLLFDIYHCQRAEGDVTAHLRHCLPWVRHVQVADSPGRNEPGCGELNWPFLFAELQRLNYQGWIGCEYRPQGGTTEGLDWLLPYTSPKK